ncbi:MAG: Cu(I)/Ag(I) efflux system membrane protein CusA [Alphaproteobacteria bacterium]|nr:MAG: Cu(I)/Ag(I) efflux system membrane protein CusA [Caulobacteraceae bacterium]TPW07587.1 MAG: Cu(I)/Ag(I) efflux system membrane protein CusA [Alphaproteobacteria bacterium]
MIANLIRWSIANRFLVVLATLALAIAGALAVRSTPVDALPDLSDVQVVVRTSYPGQAPQIVEDQVTYPLTTTMLSVPGARTVRGYSFFGDSFVYIIFEDGTDLYWARSRVLEYLDQVQGRLPATARSSLGPDATGVGWVFQYALVDRSGRHDLGQLRSIQDWLLQFELKSVPGVAEVASIGGMVRQYQIVLDPERMAAYGVSQQRVADAVSAANGEAGGAVVEIGEAEHMVRASGYLRTLEDFDAIPLGVGATGAPVRLGDVAWVQIGPEMRRGVAELNGEGEVAGGVVIIRAGENAREVIAAVRARLTELERSLPKGVEVVTTYDRSHLIDRAIENLTHKLAEEFIVVALVCALFLLHLRSAMVAVVTLPLGVLAAFLVMRVQGVDANIMSLAGIAIAIGAMVDAAIVMIENAHKKLEHWRDDHGGEMPKGDDHWRVITQASIEVGPALFFSLLIITLSFLPVFTLQAQEGRLFAPLAFTKTYAMAASAALAVTLTPVLMGFWIRGKIPSEDANPVNRFLAGLYQPAIDFTLSKPRLIIAMALVVFATTAWPLTRLGGEFMPMMDEGDLLYMPTALPGLSAAEASELLQQTDRMIRTVPEVGSVFGKAGRAETATDPAPLEMFETTIRLRPRSAWRPGMTPERIIEELDRAVRVPGLTNVWVPPIRNRIDMLATGVKSPIGVKVSGPDLASIDAAARAIERAARGVPNVSSSVAERIAGGRYVNVDIDRFAAARYGLNVGDIQAVVSGAIGGETIGQVVDGRARYPINLRYPREVRDTPERLIALPIVTEQGLRLTLGEVARVAIADGPAMIRSENGRLSAFVYIDVRGRDLASVVGDLRNTIARDVALPAGVSVAYSGQFEYLARAAERLTIVGPVTIIIIFLLLYLTFRRFDEAAIVMASLPFALTGGIWLVYLLGYDFSVAVAVGFIALAGLAAEFGVVMLMYLRKAIEERERRGEALTPPLIAEAVREGALLRLRPKAMTVAVIMAGLLPILWTGGAGAEVMRRIAAPLVGGMLSAPLLSLFVIPAAYLMIRRRGLAEADAAQPDQRIAQPAGEPS